MMASIIGSRLLAILRDTAMSGKFGWGIQTDAYRLSFTIPDLIFYGVAGGAFSSAFIPVFTEFLAKGEDDKAYDLFNVIITTVFLIVGAFVTVAFIYAEPLARFMAEGQKATANPQMIPEIVLMSRILLPGQMAFFLGGIMFGVLFCKGKFVVPGLGANIYNIGIILGALVISYFIVPPIAGMTVGAVLGAVIGNVVIPAYALKALGVKFRPSLNLKTPGVKKVFVLMLPVVLGLSLPGVYATIMQKFASMDGQGINTIIELANRVMQAPLGVFGQSLAVAAFPVLSEFAAQKNLGSFSKQLDKSLRSVIFLSVPAAAIMIALAPEIIGVFYSYGKALHESPDSLIVCIRLFALGVPAWCMHPLLMRAYFARQESLKPIVLGSLTTGVFIVLIYVLRRFGLGFESMPIAGSASAFGLVGVLLICLKLEVKEIRLSTLAKTLAKASVCAAVAGGFGWGVFHSLTYVIHHPLHKLALIGIFFVDLIVVGWIFYGIAKAFRMEETETVDRGINRIRGRFRRIAGKPAA